MTTIFDALDDPAFLAPQFAGRGDAWRRTYRVFYYRADTVLTCPASDHISNPPSTIATRKSAGTSPSR